MPRRQIIILIAAFILLGLAVGAVFRFAGINPPKDRITDLNYPPEFLCDSGENRVDFQPDGNCAAYATAYVMRSFGEQTDGEKIAPKIKRIFGFVPAKSIVRVFEKYGFSAKAYHGDVDTLKQRLSGGVPVIVFFPFRMTHIMPLWPDMTRNIFTLSIPFLKTKMRKIDSVSHTCIDLLGFAVASFRATGKRDGEKHVRGVKLTLVIVAVILILGFVAFLIIYNQPGFTGERIKNPDSYILDIQKMNGTDSHTLNLTAGDVLQVEFETEKGSLHMEITAPDSTIIYAGNGGETTDFEITIPVIGAYTVTVEARHAKGKINIRLKEVTQ